MSSDEPTSTVPVPPRRWSAPELWMLGIFSAVGLIGFAATFVLIMLRAPDAPAQRTLTVDEVRRLTGPQGERGPAGDAGIRTVRADCTSGVCTVECDNDEILMMAYCSPGRTPVVYPAEHSAQCRAQSGRKVETVAVCLKSSRR